MGTHEANYRERGTRQAEITSSVFRTFGTPNGSRFSAEGRFSREDVTWNRYHYHQLIVIVTRTVKGALREEGPLESLEGFSFIRGIFSDLGYEAIRE